MPKGIHFITLVTVLFFLPACAAPPVEAAPSELIVAAAMMYQRGGMQKYLWIDIAGAADGAKQDRFFGCYFYKGAKVYSN